MKQKANMVQMVDDESALLLAKHKRDKGDIILLSKKNVVPKLTWDSGEERVDSNLWYLDNGESNHMTDQKSKFREPDKGVIGQVKFGDGLVMKIKGKISIISMCRNGEEPMFHEVYYIPDL